VNNIIYYNIQVEGAGHMVPLNQPAASAAVIQIALSTVLNKKN